METLLSEILRPGQSRGLDFIILDELTKRTGILPYYIIGFAISEILCNALDKGASKILIELTEDAVFYHLKISDNGDRKLGIDDLNLILDFDNKASSKRGFLRISRGYLGNALKCIFGFSYAIADRDGIEPLPIIISSGAETYNINIQPDRVHGIIRSDIETLCREDDGYTSIQVSFPWERLEREIEEIKDIIFATGMVNPNTVIEYNVYGDTGTLGVDGKKSERTENATGASWYTSKQFESLLMDYIRARPEIQLKEFIALFRGFTGKAIIREILQELQLRKNHDSGVQFLPTTKLMELKTADITNLLRVLKNKSKPISKRSIPDVLGIVGEDTFEALREQMGWTRLRYIAISEYYINRADNVHFPFIVELAVFDRNNDGGGRNVYQCVNFMASTKNMFPNVFQRLGRCGIDHETPVTVVLHIISPVLNWLNYGKDSLDLGNFSELMERTFDKILPIPKTPKIYTPPQPKKALTWIPHGTIGNFDYMERLKSFASEIKFFDAQRTKHIKYSSRGWAYLLEGLGKISKDEFDSCQSAINDCRKTGLLPIDFVAEDQDSTRHISGIHNASDPTNGLKQLRYGVSSFLNELPSKTADYWTDEEYYLMMVVEKGDLLNLFAPICRGYHVPIASSKGWGPINQRADIAELSIEAEEKGLKPVLLMFYDHDPAGIKITEGYRKNLRDLQQATGWDPSGLIIDRFGLNADDIEQYELTWIDNLKTSSGKDSTDDGYIRKFGNRKCEANALFKNDGTLEAGEKICRKAIEKYYGADALKRFQSREDDQRKKYSQLYDNPLWESLDKQFDDFIKEFTKEQKAKEQESLAQSVELKVDVDGKFYGICPECRKQFNYMDADYGKLKVCRGCGASLRLCRS